jgi:hypothetical protein
MANPEHLAILKDALDKKDIGIWNRWRNQNPTLRSDLSGIDLRKANLRKADLSQADLSQADLDGADLRVVNLSYSDLTQTNLDKTRFNKTIFNETKFSNIDLSTTLNLDQAIFYGPCDISISTLYKSKGNIPESFLRACGVPDDVIALAVSIRGTIQYYKTFISYSHQDMIFARRLEDTLQGRGIRCWRDEKQIKPGKIIREEVYKGIRYHEKLLLLCLKDSLNSPAVEEEIEHIFSEEDAERKRLQAEADEAGNTEKIDIPLRLIPIDIDGYLFSPECHSRFKHRIKSRLAARFNGWESDNGVFEDQIEKVVWALEMD